jgi:hypothetical protein
MPGLRALVIAGQSGEKAAQKGEQRMRHKKLLTAAAKAPSPLVNELMYDFDKKSKQNIRAIYYCINLQGHGPRLKTTNRDSSEALNSPD